MARAGRTDDSASVAQQGCRISKPNVKRQTIQLWHVFVRAGLDSKFKIQRPDIACMGSPVISLSKKKKKTPLDNWALPVQVLHGKVTSRSARIGL